MNEKQYQTMLLVMYVMSPALAISLWLLNLALLVRYDNILLAISLVYTSAYAYGVFMYLKREYLQDTVLRAVTNYGLKHVWCPGNFDFKIKEVKSSQCRRKDYVVLIRSEGKTGFTFMKSAYKVDSCGFGYSEELLELATHSAEAARSLLASIESEGRAIESAARSWERDRDDISLFWEIAKE